MKEIGLCFLEARESIGVSLEEAATDLKTTVEQIVNLENGNMEAFKDVFVLKYFIRDYAKYLGLDKDDMVDEFNEYLFDYTSKLSLDEIKKATKEHNKKDNKIKSPYTLIDGSRKKSPLFIIGILGLVIAIVLIVVFVVGFGNNNNDDIIAYALLIRRAL